MRHNGTGGSPRDARTTRVQKRGTHPHKHALAEELKLHLEFWKTGVPVVLALVLLAAYQIACKDEGIRKAARAADDMAVTISLAIDAKRELAAAGLLPPEQELPLTLGLQKVNTAVKAFHLQVKNTRELDPTAKNKLLALFSGVTESVAELHQQGVLGIKNEEAKTKVSAVLAGFTVAMAAIQAALT